MPENAADTAANEPVEAPVEAPAQDTDWKAEARKWEQRAKDNKARLDEAEPIVSQWKAFEEASKTELERKSEEAARWQAEADKWRTASVGSRIETLAALDFADPSDAVSQLDPSKYLDAGGQINEAAIRADLSAVLERKPHWRRAEAAAFPASRVPAPNPAQGSGVNGKAAPDPAAEFAAIIQGQLNRS